LAQRIRHGTDPEDRAGRRRADSGGLGTGWPRFAGSGCATATVFGSQPEFRPSTVPGRFAISAAGRAVWETGAHIMHSVRLFSYAFVRLHANAWARVIRLVAAHARPAEARGPDAANVTGGPRPTSSRPPREVIVESEVFEVTVEIPQGSRNKYEMDHEAGRIRLDRLLFTATRYPADYGYVDGTLGRDGDPLDALVLTGEPTFPGCVIDCRAIGMFAMRDEMGPDEKILCVPAHDPRYEAVQDILDVPEFDRLEITHFFEVYKDLEPGKSVEGAHWEDRRQAYQEIENSRLRKTGAPKRPAP
jgi:inorganic pyrophosphatase